MEALFECQFCHELTLASELKESLCPCCQKYLIPAFMRKQEKTKKLYLIKGGKNEIHRGDPNSGHGKSS
jgi:hypothetical protein